MLKYILIILLLSCAVYSNILGNHFVSDDIPTISDRQDLGRVFKYPDISSIANSLDYLVGGKTPLVYHLTNILLHALVSVLVFYFLLVFFGLMPSFWGAVIFAVHPVHTEAVTWVSGRPYLFLTLFVLSSFLLYVRATRNMGKLGNIVRARGEAPSREQHALLLDSGASGALARRIFLFLSLITFTLALFSWISALLFPVIIILYDVIFGRWRRTRKYWLWFLIPVAIKLIAIKGLVSQRVVEVSMDTGSTAFTNPLFNSVYSFFYHSYILLWPAKLTLYREPMIITSFWLKVEISAVAVILLCLPFIYKRSKQMFFALCFFVLFLSPTFSPITICWLVADRYIYLPSVAFSMVIAFFVEKSAKPVNINKGDGSIFSVPKGALKNRTVPFILVLFLSGLVAAYSARTLLRNRDWRTHASIWRATVAASPASPKAHLNMGDVWSLEGDLERSAQEFRLTAQLKPDYAEAYHNLANIYYKMGRIDDAIVNYRKAATLKPSLWQSYQDMGIIYYQKGDYANARDCFKKAVEINPGNAELQVTLKQLEGLSK